MKCLIVLLALIVSVSCLGSITGSTQIVAQSSVDDVAVPIGGGANIDFATNIASTLINHLASKINTFVEVFNVKLRLINLLVSLYTPENLDLLRSGLSLTARFANYIVAFIPTGTVTVSPYDQVIQFIFSKTGLLPTTETPIPDPGEVPAIVVDTDTTVEVNNDNGIPVDPPAEVITQAPLERLSRGTDFTSRFLKRYREAQNLQNLINSGLSSS